MRCDVATSVWRALFCLLMGLCSLASAGAAAAAQFSGDELRPMAARLFGQEEVRISVGPLKGEPPAHGVFRNGHLIGYLASTWKVARSVGYSGKPIDIMVAVDTNGILHGAEVVEQSEPVLILGISHEDLAKYVESFSGLDLAAQGIGNGEKIPGIPEVFSGATVSSSVMRDAIQRTGMAIATSRGIIKTGTARQLAPATFSEADWSDLVEEGAIARRRITIGEANQALGVEARADDAATFIELYATLLTPPRIGQNLLGTIDYSELASRLGAGDQAILVAGNGLYSFKGTSYRQSGVFDRIELIQGAQTIHLGAANYRNVKKLAIDGAPALREIGQFIIPADSGFDASQPWQINLVATRDLEGGAVAVAEFALPYRLPERYLTPTTAGAAENGPALYWLENWQSRVPGIAVIIVMLAVLSAILVFQDWIAERYRLYRIVRLTFLTATLFLLGWWLGAQLSVVHVISFVQALLTGFSWELFLLDPFVLILWSFVAVALLFWGRGVFCGWLCPFGALQELLNEIARKAGLRQINVNFAVHERLWPIKYIIFLGLFAVSLTSVKLAFMGAEVEPFKTVITLKFVRYWPFVVFALSILALGLFIERFYCRYLCPLGAALAIPARLRMFDWLKRRKQCGTECGVCARHCTVQAIHPNGSINPNECIHCLNCQMLYYDERTCPPLIERAKRRQRRAAVAARHKAEAAAGSAAGGA